MKEKTLMKSAKNLSTNMIHKIEVHCKFAEDILIVVMATNKNGDLLGPTIKPEFYQSHEPGDKYLLDCKTGDYYVYRL